MKTHTTNTDDPICFPKPLLQELSDMATSYCDSLDIAEQKFYEIVWRREFAELIVNECAAIVADAVDHREPASTYVSKIKQRFGVE